MLPRLTKGEQLFDLLCCHGFPCLRQDTVAGTENPKLPNQEAHKTLASTHKIRKFKHAANNVRASTIVGGLLRIFLCLPMLCGPAA